jgi:hypothetical protein
MQFLLCMYTNVNHQEWYDDGVDMDETQWLVLLILTLVQKDLDDLNGVVVSNADC